MSNNERVQEQPTPIDQYQLRYSRKTMLAASQEQPGYELVPQKCLHRSLDGTIPMLDRDARFEGADAIQIGFWSRKHLTVVDLRKAWLLGSNPSRVTRSPPATSSPQPPTPVTVPPSAAPPAGTPIVVPGGAIVARVSSCGNPGRDWPAGA